MSFASETVLKFGSSPVSFAVVTLLSYSMQNEKMGAFNYRRKEVISLEGLFSQKGVAQSVTEHFKDVKNLLANSVDFVDLKLNDVLYGKARFISFSFPTSVNFDENAINLSKFTIQLEIIKVDDDSTFADANLPSDVKTLRGDDLWQWHKLKDFSEDFSFKLGEDGNFEASHGISFQYDPGEVISDASLTIAAADIANGFFKQALQSLSSIYSLYSSADFQSSTSDYGSSLTEQSVDLINYKFAYSKNYTVFSQNNGLLTSETITTEVSYKDDGSIEVSEKGRIKGKGAAYTTARSNAMIKLNTNLSDAYTRCNASFSRIQGVLPKYSGSNTLQTNPVSITKDLTDVTSEVGYEIKFTTNPAYSDVTSIHTYSILLKKDSLGVYEVSKDGSIRLYTNKRKDFIDKISVVKAIIDSNDLSEIDSYYKKISGLSDSYVGIKTASTMTFAKFGVETSYSKTYSNSPTLRASGANVIVRKLTTTETYTDPVNKFSTIKLIGSSSKLLGKEIIYQTRQLSQGSRNISLEMKIDREQLYDGSANGVNTSTASIFTKIKDLLTSKILDAQSGHLFSGSSPLVLSIFAKIYASSSLQQQDLTYFLDDLKLSIDNNYNLKVDLVFKFLMAKEQT
jgi:hypothetical protein